MRRKEKKYFLIGILFSLMLFFGGLFSTTLVYAQENASMLENNEGVTTLEVKPSTNENSSLESTAENKDGNGLSATSHVEGNISEIAETGNSDAKPLSADSVLTPPVSSDNVIYLDGVKGNDTNDGLTKNTAVKTFARAKELAGNNFRIEKIVVIGTTDIQGDISLEGTKAILSRDNDFSGYMLRVNTGNEATLSNIIVDGAGDGIPNKLSMIQVLNGILNIQKDTILRNNKIKVLEDPNKTGVDRISAAEGGAIHATNSTINMIDGEITENEATNGGGIYLSKSTLNMSGGSIHHNEVARVEDTTVTPTQYYAAGGGVCINNGSVMNFSGGSITNNKSAEVGGGISVGTRTWSNGKDYLNMSGGIVDANQAGAAGGGIFVQLGYGNRHATATIEGGEITNNVMNGTGVTEQSFGGGGIYVNGIDAQYSEWTNGELILKNALITDNKAAFAGGGYAACPVSNTRIYVTDGAAIYQNTSEKNMDIKGAQGKNSNEIYIAAVPSRYFGSHGGNPAYTISERMLGGQPYNWKNENNEPVDKNLLSGTLDSSSLEQKFLHTDEVASPLTLALARVRIAGNYSVTRGGGIGSNGNVTIGTDTPKKDLYLKKIWGEGVTPESIELEVGVDIDGQHIPFETLTLNENNHFERVIKDLPASFLGKNLEDVVYVKELNGDKFRTTISKAVKRKAPKTLSFDLFRPQFSDYENIGATYQNTKAFDRDKWDFNDFSVAFHLHIEGDPNTYTETMNYKSESFSWSEIARFSKIPFDGDDIAIEYYGTSDNDPHRKNFFKPNLFEYDLYLKKDKNGNWVLQIPYLYPMMYDKNGKEVTNEKILSVRNIVTGNTNDGANLAFVIRVKNDKPTPPPPSYTPNKPVYTTIKGTKKWIGDEEGNRPKSIEVLLVNQDNEKIVEKITVSEKTNWQYTFDHVLAKDASGKVYRYRVEEVVPEGYSVHYNGYDITNTKVKKPKYTNIEGNKIWIGDTEADRPNAIKVKLIDTLTGKTIKTISVTAETNWHFNFEHILLKDEQDVIHSYRVEEMVPAGYTVRYDGYNIINEKNKLPKPPTPLVPHKPHQPPEPPAVPQTGDINDILIYLFMLLSAGMALLVIGKKKVS